jgi:hypothetical protein
MSTKKAGIDLSVGLVYSINGFERVDQIDSDRHHIATCRFKALFSYCFLRALTDFRPKQGMLRVSCRFHSRAGFLQALKVPYLVKSPLIFFIENAIFNKC